MRLFQNFMIFILLTAIGILYKRYEAKYFPDEELDKYSLVRKYLLNGSDSMTGKEKYGFTQNMTLIVETGLHLVREIVEN